MESLLSEFLKFDVITMISTLGMLCILAQTWFLGNLTNSERVRGFIFGVVGCTCWGTVGYYNSNLAMVLVNFILFFVCVRGIIKNAKEM